MLELILNKFKKEDIGEPPYDYNFLISLSESEYPKYLKKMFKAMTGKELNLKHPKTFNEKIQWIKLYDNKQQKSELTDKVKVREWVREKIGEKYLKPVLWVGDKFDDIPFNTLPYSFIIKANHGCKWQYKIKDKEEFIKEEALFNYIKERFDGWMSQTFFPWAGFEMQYKGIEPKIIIEPILIDEDKQYPIEYEIYCFNERPKIYQKIEYSMPPKCSVYNEDYSESELRLNPEYIKENEPAGERLKEAVELSKELAAGFKLVRVDWLLYRNQIYFNEMTFTPFSGFFAIDDKTNLKIGKMLKL